MNKMLNIMKYLCALRNYIFYYSATSQPTKQIFLLMGLFLDQSLRCALNG